MRVRFFLFRNRPFIMIVSMIVVAGLQLAAVRSAFGTSNSVEHRQQISAPVIISTPVTEAFVGQEYMYTVKAEGTPAPVFQLSAAPAGMTIHVNTGVISWVPQTSGTFGVQVLVTNSAGTASQRFNIRVAKAVNLESCPTHMKAYWQLEEISGSAMFTDIYGQYHASCKEASCPIVASGQVDNGQYFDGNKGLSLPDPSTFNWGNADSFSIEAWVNTTQVCSSNAVFVGKYRAPGSQASWWLGCGPGGQVRFFLRDSDRNMYDVVSNRSISDGNWHHVVAVRNAADKNNYLYIDGLLESSVPTTYTGGFASTNLVSIGSYIGTHHYVGILDELAIYDSALPAATIEQHYQNGLAGLGYCPESTSETPPQITSSPVTEAVIGQTYHYQVTATGFPVPAFQLLTKPEEMEIDAVTGLIRWVPYEAGKYEVTVQAVNSSGSITQSFSVTVTDLARAPVITSSPVVTGSVGQTYAYDVKATGNPAPNFQLNGTQPEGMTIGAATGSIRWIPSRAGNFPVTVRASNSAGSIDQSFTVSVTEPLRMPMITSTPVTQAIINQPYNYEVIATGYPTPTFQLTNEPAGMTIDANTGLISWVPESTGNYNIKVEAINSAGSISQDFVLLVRSSLWLPAVHR